MLEGICSAFTPAEVERAQAIYQLSFPPDFVDFLLNDRQLATYDWRTDNTTLRDMLAWPADGLIFDVENNALWLADWGERPNRAIERAEIVRNAVATAPKLIPVYSHRYLPADPPVSGNPVFSVYQSDIIIYGADLNSYVQREQGNSLPLLHPGDIRRIRFWSHLIDLNNDWSPEM